MLTINTVIKHVLSLTMYNDDLCMVDLESDAEAEGVQLLHQLQTL